MATKCLDSRSRIYTSLALLVPEMYGLASSLTAPRLVLKTKLGSQLCTSIANIVYKESRFLASNFQI